MASRRNQITMTDDEVTAYLEGQRVLNVATIGPSGHPHVVAMWYVMLDGKPAFWTFGKSQKIVNLQRDPKITALVEDGDTYNELRGAELSRLALLAGSASADLVEAGRAIDAGGLLPDRHRVNSWTQRVNEVDPLELLEVQLCNMTAPFILVSRLRAALSASAARRKYIVNVSAMEGIFGRGYKGPGHPHTNMAKAALNMLTRTSATEMLTDGILMTAVDTGWITDERPHYTKTRLAEEGFHAPLDLVDGAARVYDPIVQGEAGDDLYGCFLKDYRPAQW